jgi:peptidoglycan pentaglycine glycine transferase (the first glycine)
MNLKELTILEFEDFVKKSPLGNHYQTSDYGILMSEQGYDYDLLGMVDEYGEILAASLILIKKIGFKTKYGYAPKGFILDYFNQSLLKAFTEKIKEFYDKKNVIFIKINPEIAIAEIDSVSKSKTYNWNSQIKDFLDDLNYLKLKDNLYFESCLPRFNGIISLKDLSINHFEKNTRNKIKRAVSKGLEIELTERSGIDILYNFIKNKKHNNEFYYKDYYNIFHKKNMIDIFLVSINTKDFLLNAKENYEKELEINTELNRNLIQNNNQKNINLKMNSDRKLLSYKNDILEATDQNSKHEKIYIAGAMVIKFKNRVQILISGYDKKYKKYNPNYFLHYKIMEHYKEDYSYFDLNGMTGDFTKENPYYGLNEFKIGFKPKIYEFIGEYDLIINNKKYNNLLNNGTLAKIFNKTNLKEKVKNEDLTL